MHLVENQPFQSLIRSDPPFENVSENRIAQPLGRDVEQDNPAIQQPLKDLGLFIARMVGVEVVHRHPKALIA